MTNPEVLGMFEAVDKKLCIIHEKSSRELSDIEFDLDEVWVGLDEESLKKLMNILYRVRKLKSFIGQFK